MLTKGRTFGAEPTQERDQVVLGRLLHLGGRKRGEPSPSQIAIWAAIGDLLTVFVGDRNAVMAIGEEVSFKVDPSGAGLTRGPGLRLVEPLQEQQESQLLHDGLRVRQPSGPHGVPYPVDLRLHFTGYHACP